MEKNGKQNITDLPPIPAKRYFTIGEVSELCGVKAHVLRYWEQEFPQLKPAKRRGNRRYYQHHELLLIRRIRELLYTEGFTINGARNKLDETGVTVTPAAEAKTETQPSPAPISVETTGNVGTVIPTVTVAATPTLGTISPLELRQSLQEILDALK